MVIDFGVDGGKKRNFDKQKYPDAYLIGPINFPIYTISAMRVGLHNVDLFIGFIEFCGFFFTLGI